MFENPSEKIIETTPSEISFFYDVKMDVLQILALDNRIPNLKNILWCLFCFDAFMVLFSFRVRRLALKYHIPVVNRLIRMLQVIFYAIEIGSNARLGHGVIFVHTVGSVIDGTIGNGCMFMGSNTLGNNGRINGTPKLGAGVTIGCGARILGPVTIGHRAVIGPNATVFNDVPEKATVFEKPSRTMTMN